MGINSVQVIAVTAGKGGVGKTSVSVNLAISLAQAGRKVLLLDADLGLANVDVMLGVSPRKNISHVLAGQCELQDIFVPGPAGISIVPASSGAQEMAHLSSLQHAGLVHAFSSISEEFDVMIVDTAAGIADSVVSFLRAAQEVLMVVCNEPTSITDTYALIKILNQSYGLSKFHIVTNMIRSLHEGKEIYSKLLKVTDRFLDVALEFSGEIPYDDYLRKSIQRQKSVCLTYPASKSALAFKKISEKINRWPVQSTPRGNLEFFVDRLFEKNAASA